MNLPFGDKMFLLFTLKTFGLFLGLDRTSRSPDLKVISTDGTTRDPRVRETDGAEVVTSMTSKNLSRLEHVLEADGALVVVVLVVVREVDLGPDVRSCSSVILDELANEGIVNAFVLHLRLPLPLLFGTPDATVVVVVKVAADIKVPLEVDFAIGIVRKNILFVFSKFFVNQFC